MEMMYYLLHVDAFNELFLLYLGLQRLSWKQPSSNCDPLSVFWTVGGRRIYSSQYWCYSCS